MHALSWWQQAASPIHAASAQAAFDRQQQLTKPAGALGLLEQIAITLAGMQGVTCPQLRQPFISIFAADHGIAAAGVSAFPSAVTAQMVANFAQGGAAICVLARQIHAHFEVVDVGVATDTTMLAPVIQAKTQQGTANFLEQAAMDQASFDAALAAGQDAVARALAVGADAFIGGEMGIGNTTSASTLACVWLDAKPSEMSGAGTGLDSVGIAHKATVIEQALTLHQPDHQSAVAVIQTFAGFEMVALMGAYIAAAQAGLPIIVDGFISSVAALSALKLNPTIRPWMLFGHQSAEYAHQRILTALQASPVLQLGMRLGEGSGAATAWTVLQSACALHAQMATFAEAAVSGQQTV
jgi:nicotinate-nucleotide--dimethylbenzimidazole phosphoribosyltransferase